MDEMDREGSSALYRKYRSQDFDELVGQPHVTTSLANALKAGRISHAYLFAGPRGTGKTSAARIFAGKVNAIKPDEVSVHLDIIEIDAASNRRIDEVRDLREKVHSAPTSAKYKVYIIDEAHMLTTEAFNALLKVLEEPPAHVIFILATTEPHKLPETIISRTQSYNFRPLPEATILEQLQQIARVEKIKADKEALELIAMAADGSMRDGLSLLDQLANLASGKVISWQLVGEQLGLAQTNQLAEVTRTIIASDLQKLVAELDKLVTSGVNPQQFGQQLARYVARLIRAIVSSDRLPNQMEEQLTAELSLSQLLKTAKAVNQLNSGARQNWAAVEATLIDLALDFSAAPTASEAKVEPKPKPITSPQPARAKTPPSKTSENPLAGLRRAQSSRGSGGQAPLKKSRPEVTEALAKPGRSLTEQATPTTPGTKKPTKSGNFNEDLWLKTLSVIRSNHSSLYALLKSAVPKFDQDRVRLSFQFQFHRRRLEEAKNKSVLTRAMAEVYDQPIVIETALLKKRTGAGQPEPGDKDAVASVLQILGGEVVKENH